MIIVLSPSKTLDFSQGIFDKYTNPDFLAESMNLIENLRKLSIDEIAKLMKISNKLAILNYQRYQDFQDSRSINIKNNQKQAIYAFKGDVYDGFAVDSLKEDDITTYAQNHLRIISGLYGLIKPLDLIQPYRLEMGTKLGNKGSKNLYEYWGDKITMKINEDIKYSKANILVNLASEEYFKAINQKVLQGDIITPIFKERKQGTEKVVGLFAKRARGMMASYLVKNRIEDIEGIRKFNESGYRFNRSLSGDKELIFVRDRLN